MKFNEFFHALNILDKIREGEISLADVKNDQIVFKSNLGNKKGNKKYKSKKRTNTLHNNGILYKARNNIIKFLDDYSSVISETKYEAAKGTGLTILTPEQIFQRLPLALVQIKTGNNSPVTLNEIRPIAYSLHQSKEMTKNVRNNITKSIQI